MRKIDESASIEAKADSLYAKLSSERPNDPELQAVRRNAEPARRQWYREAGRWPEGYRALRDAESYTRQVSPSARAPGRATRLAASSLVKMGFEYAKLGLWDETASAFSRACEIDESSVLAADSAGGGSLHAWFRVALMFLHAGKTDAYRRLCKQMLAESAHGDSTAMLNTMRTTTLSAAAFADWGRGGRPRRQV